VENWGTRGDSLSFLIDGCTWKGEKEGGIEEVRDGASDPEEYVIDLRTKTDRSRSGGE